MSQDSARVEQAALETEREANPVRGVLSTSVGRNAGLVVALLLICAVGAFTAGDRFASSDNALTILRLAAGIGVVSIGMTFVIIGGGIDLSVGAIVALSSVWCTTVATQTMAEDTHWIVMVVVALLVGAGCGVVNGVLIAYGNIVPFIMTLAMLASARGLAEIISDKKTQIIPRQGFAEFFNGDFLGVTCRSGCSHWSRSWAGSCSTARRSAAVPSPSAATPRRPDWPASTSSGTPSTSTC